MNKTALLTGITGQTASYLAEYLLAQGYSVHGVVRRISQPNTSNLTDIIDKITLHPADMTDSVSISNAIQKAQPDEIYNLAGQSQVRWSYDIPVNTFDVNTLGLLRIIEAVRSQGLKSKIYQACSSEMFGKVQQTPQTEATPFYPRSPYGVSKTAAYYMARTYRESYGMPIYCGILFNHESPRRGEEFLSRKVCKYVASVVHGRIDGGKDKLKLGNLDSCRDWGYAKEYAEWVYNIMQYREPEDFVIATGETHSVREWVELAFDYVGLDFNDYITYDKDLMRPAEVDLLLGDASKSERLLGFKPQVKFPQLVKIMMDAELAQCNSNA